MKILNLSHHKASEIMIFLLIVFTMLRYVIICKHMSMIQLPGLRNTWISSDVVYLKKIGFITVLANPNADWATAKKVMVNFQCLQSNDSWIYHSLLQWTLMKQCMCSLWNNFVWVLPVQIDLLLLVLSALEDRKPQVDYIL